MSRRIFFEAFTVVLRLRVRRDARPAAAQEHPLMRLEPAAPAPPPDAVRVVLDARPLQEPERSPLTAWYLDQLLARLRRGAARRRVVRPRVALAAAGSCRRCRATRACRSRHRDGFRRRARTLRSASLTLDSFLLRGAEVGTRGAPSAEDGPTPAVFHTAGGAVPLASGLPVVATILDLAPWELPGDVRGEPRGALRTSSAGARAA